MADPQPSYFGGDQRFSTVYQTQPPPRGPSVFGYGLTNSGGLEGALGSVAPMLAEVIQRQLGGVFNFAGELNVYQARIAREYLQNLNEARTKGAAVDAEGLRDVLRGLAVGIGQPVERFENGKAVFNPEFEGVLTRISKDASGLLPFLAAAFPDMVDKAIPGGSVAAAQANFLSAGRFLYNPLTGTNLSDDPEFGVNVLAALQGRGGRATAGLRAVRLGQTFEELTRFGLVNPGDDLKRKVDDGELTRDEASKVQVDRAKGVLTDYSKAISAVNDIFGEYGRTNAPIQELFRGLQALSYGGLGSFDPATLTRVLRTIQGGAQLSGLGLEGSSAVIGAAGSALERVGANRALAPYVGTFLMGLGRVAPGAGLSAPGPEAMTRDELLAAATGDLAAGAASPFANLLGAVSYQARYAKEGSPLALLAEGLRKGESVVDLGGGRTFNVRDAALEDFDALAVESGLAKGAVTRQLRQARQNSAALATDPALLLKATREAQQAEVEAMLATQLGANNLGEKAPKIIGDIYEVLDKEGGKIRSDSDLVNALLAKGTVTREEASLLGPILGDVGASTRYGFGVNAFKAFNPETTKNTIKMIKMFEARGAEMAALAGLGRGGLLAGTSRLLTGLGAGEAADSLRNWARTFGFVGDEEADRELFETWKEAGFKPGTFGPKVEEELRKKFLGGGFGAVLNRARGDAPAEGGGGGFLGDAVRGAEVEARRANNPFFGAPVRQEGGAFDFLDKLIDSGAADTPAGGPKEPMGRGGKIDRIEKMTVEITCDKLEITGEKKVTLNGRASAVYA